MMAQQSILRILLVQLDLVRIYYTVEKAIQTNSATNNAEKTCYIRIYIWSKYKFNLIFNSN